jgi:multicomponent Na+:H+ antiporter subunit C
MYIALMMVGFYAMIAKNNLVKKIIGMNILQTAVILFFISTGAKMLTAIVVAVSTLGVALALVIKLYQQYQTLEEDEILDQLGDE